MTATKQESSKGQADEAQPESKRETTKASEYFEPAVAFVRKQGAKGATLKQIGEALNLRGRIVHNLGWRLEGSPEIHDNAKVKRGVPRKPDEVKLQRRSGTGRSVVYELAKPARTRKATKATAKAS